MIQYNPRSWLTMIFGHYSRFVVRSLFPLLFFVAIFTAFNCFLILEVFKLHFLGTLELHSILGILLGLFLVLRTNTAYDRWWEGRKLWGQLVNDTRHLAIKIESYLPKTDAENRRFFRMMISNMAFSFKEHLRDNITIGDLEFTDDEMKNIVIASKHRPNKLSSLMMNRIVELHKSGVISGDQLIIADRELKGFTDVLGACERIKSTPIPNSFSMFIRKFLFIFAITLPISFAWDIGYWTILVVVFVFYFLVSIELISEEIENPFGSDLNDLPLDELSIKIKANVEEIISE